MAREIKFRAFIENEMFETDDLEHFFGVTFLHKDSIIMQYTGLKDKNGKEIYEGDVIKQIWCSLYEEVGYIECDNEAPHEFMFKILSGGDFFYSLGHAIDSSTAMVIGNIYENPKLLERLK